LPPLTIPSTPPTPKRHNLPIYATIRIRNAGATTSFLHVSALANSGSDTEDEHDEEIAQFHLNRMSDYTDRESEVSGFDGTGEERGRERGKRGSGFGDEGVWVM
jgi:hypothetical protein